MGHPVSWLGQKRQEQGWATRHSRFARTWSSGSENALRWSVYGDSGACYSSLNVSQGVARLVVLVDCKGAGEAVAIRSENKVFVDATGTDQVLSRCIPGYGKVVQFVLAFAYLLPNAQTKAAGFRRASS